MSVPRGPAFFMAHFSKVSQDSQISPSQASYTIDRSSEDRTIGQQVAIKVIRSEEEDFSDSASAVNGIAWEPVTGERLATASSDGALRIWTPGNGRYTGYDGHNGALTSAA